jgi:hypothetical protein
MSSFISYENPVQIELALMALAASPTAKDAVAYLKAEHDIVCVESKLTGLARYHTEQYEELRQRIAPLKEKQLANNLLDNALYASDVTAQAIGQLQERIKYVKTDQLSRVARDLADVQAKAVDKRLALEGRPTVITETRSAPEIIRALESMRVVKPVEITQGEAIDVGT